MKRFLFALAVLTFGAGIALAQMGGADRPGSAGSPSGSSMGSGSTGSAAESSGPANTALSRLDTDQDGTVSKTEAARDKQISNRFAELDSNKDGNLSATELAAATGKTGSPGAGASSSGAESEEEEAE